MRSQYEPNYWITQRFDRSDRYYVIRLQQNLFGEWIIIAEWGSKLSARGRTETSHCKSLDEATKRFRQEIHRRKQRGYDEAA